ncbi:putative ATP-dependent protease ATP-binding subunit ClpL [Staphylococcus aureus]|nr:putative ATP-dependent protease ATP-binding subunit ClpL [Staphylococcus aureus]
MTATVQLAVFLFVGPTGVGKTELAKQLAIDLFGNKDALIRLDMSEYSDTTAVSKMMVQLLVMLVMIQFKYVN